MLDWSLRSVSLGRILVYLALALMLFVWVSTEQDAAIASQSKQIQYRKWFMGETIVKHAVVIEREVKRRCIRFRFDDLFPLGETAFFCDSSLWEDSRKGDRFRVGVRRFRVEWIEKQ